MLRDLSWRPRSILQLLLIGFIAVVAPLGAAVVIAVQALVEQAQASAALTERTVTLTRATQRLQSDLIDLERRARQFATLEDPALLRLVMDGLDELDGTLATVRESLDDDASEADRLGGQLHELERELMLVPLDRTRLEPTLARFDAISARSAAIAQASRRQVDAELAAQLGDAAATRTRIVVTASALALLAVPLALLFTYWINRPIRELARVIRAIGGAKARDAVRIHGPREMQLLGAELAWLRDRLAELDAQKQQFLRHISHELKTPLASLREGADLLAEGVVGPALTPAQREVVDIVQQNSRELQRLIENLLDYNQLAHREDTYPETVALAPLAAEVVAAHRLAFERRGLRVLQRGEQAQWVLNAGKLRTALDNLVSNAANYGRADGEVLVHWYAHGDTLTIDVANDGEPIAPQEAERIFEPFFQGSSNRRGAVRGSGIGLAVARQCIESQGGTLGVVAHADYGVCFRITLPRLEESP